MAENIVMPKLAMAMKQGKIVGWKANEGDRVEKGQIVMVIETEKVTYEVEAPAAGFLHIVGAIDTVYPVEVTVAQLAETEEELAELQAAQPAPASATSVVAATEAPNAAAAPATTAAPAVSSSGGRVKITPSARKLAKKNNLDIASIPGTGPGGRIKKEDVIAFMESGGAAAAPAAVPAEAWTGEVVDGKRVKVSLPYIGMREAIGNHMVQSLATSAQLSTIGEIDVTELVRIRKSYLAKEKELGLRISYTDIMVYLFTQAIKSNPMVNSSLVDGEIKIWEDINFGVAIVIDAGEYDSGLIVPVIKQAQDKSLLEIAQTLRDLFSRARSGELMPDEVSGGTITLSNLGAFAKGWQVGTPILNQPQSVIMATGSIMDKAVGVDGQVVLRPHLSISFTYDHRVLDGVPIAKYYQTISDMAANPEYMLL